MHLKQIRKYVQMVRQKFVLNILSRQKAWGKNIISTVVCIIWRVHCIQFFLLYLCLHTIHMVINFLISLRTHSFLKAKVEDEIIAIINNAFVVRSPFTRLHKYHMWFFDVVHHLATSLRENISASGAFQGKGLFI